MRALYFIAILTGILLGCTPQQDQKIDDTVKAVQSAVNKGCGVIPSAIDIAILVQRPDFAGVLQVANTICQQVLVTNKTMTLIHPECLAVVDGVCVHKE